MAGYYFHQGCSLSQVCKIARPNFVAIAEVMIAVIAIVIKEPPKLFGKKKLQPKT